MTQKGKSSLMQQEKTPRQTRRSARAFSIGQEQDFTGAENMNLNNRMSQIPLMTDVSFALKIT
jgi:hypothetical protein